MPDPIQICSFRRCSRVQKSFTSTQCQTLIQKQIGRYIDSVPILQGYEDGSCCPGFNFDLALFLFGDPHMPDFKFCLMNVFCGVLIQ